MPRRGTRAQPQPQGGNTSGKKPTPYPAWTRAAMASGDWVKYSSAGVRAPSIWLMAPVVMGMGLEGSNSTRRWPDKSSRERLSPAGQGMTLRQQTHHGRPVHLLEGDAAFPPGRQREAQHAL